MTPPPRTRNLTTAHSQPGAALQVVGTLIVVIVLLLAVSVMPLP